MLAKDLEAEQVGYRISLDNGTLVAVNQKVIEEELERKKKEYLQNEELTQIAQLYESRGVAFKIKLFAGSSLKEVALKGAINLKATWVILNRKMKKDEEFFLQKLSCGISILRRKNRIVHLRGPLDIPVEIQCNSHETYDESLPSIPYEDLFTVDVFPESTFKEDVKNQIQLRRYEEERCSTFTTNIKEKPCPTSPYHLNKDKMEITCNQMAQKIEKVKQHRNQEQIQSMVVHEKESNTSLVINNDQTNAQEIAEQPSQGAEKANNFQDEKCNLRHPTKSEEMIDQTKDHLNQNQAQKLSISNGVILDGQQEKSNLENSMCIFCSVCKTRRPIEGPREFNYEELQEATDAFSLKNCLSESGQLFTFRGKLKEELKLVVKQHDITNTQVREKMKSEIQAILKARHKNVIMLLGSTTVERSLLTVYEYACNGSLDKYLSKESCRPLAWMERERVAIGLARGLKYLHDNNIVHGNIKASNILLTHDFKPLIGDFGFGKKLELKSYKNKNRGNYDYLAPEYQKGKLSTKTDVYSFGVVILELISGRRTTDIMSEDKSLVEWAKPLLKGKNYSELMDPTIRNSYEEDHLRWLVQVTAQCLKKNPKERLSMNMVVSALQGIADSELCNMTEDITPAISCSRIVSERDGSQGSTKADKQSQEEDQTESKFYGEERKLTLTIENNHFYMLGLGNSDKLSQIEEQMQNRSQGEERSSEKMIINDHEMDQTAVDQLSESKEQMPSTLYREANTTQKNTIDHMIGHSKIDQLRQNQEEGSSIVEMKTGLIPAPISGMTDQTKADKLVQDKTQMQIGYHENLLNGNQGKNILENSKSFACSICKSIHPNIAWQKDYTYDELLEATEGFSIENSLSEIEDGPTFKGMLERRVKIVVKKYQITKFHEEKIFKSEVQLLINARHKNVVMLLGLCTNKSELMIVYEQVCNGSLDQYLTRGSFQSLTWNQRLKVAIGTARGLKYLHGNNIIHGNLKPSNILLTHDFEPQIGDFSFGKVKPELKKSSKDKSVRNSGYTAPEYQENGKLSNKIDVYSFGVILLELITGRRAMDKLPGGKSLVGWAKPLLGGKRYPQLVDSKISNSYEDEKLLWLVQVTEQCLRKNPKERFTMNMSPKVMLSLHKGHFEVQHKAKKPRQETSTDNVVSALQGIAESAECCVVENSSPEKPYLPHDEPGMKSIQGGKRGLTKNHMIGQMKAEPVRQEQGEIESNQYEEERSLILKIKTDHMIGQRNADQLRQNREDVQSGPHEMSRVTVTSDSRIDQINHDQQSQEKHYIKGSFHLEEMGIKEVDKQEKVVKDEKQIQGICDDDLLNGNEGKINLENSQSSACSICKSRRPNSAFQKKFTYEELQAVTEGFSIKYSLSEDEYGPSFRGHLDNNLEIVIKQHELTSLQDQKEFMSEFQLLINSRHENVIMMLGSCIRKSQLLIVYEQACNGSLDQYLSRASGRSLTWRERVKIAIGVARGLNYLHENNIIHARVKPSNILLNHEFKPMLGDFSFGKERHELKNCSKDKSMPYCGYTAPECQESGKLSTKADVYSFGIVLLELITGCMITDKIPGQKCLIGWARPLLGGGKSLELVDPKISSSYDEEELVSLVQVTVKCLRNNPKERITMNMVVSALLCVADNSDIYVTEDSSPRNSNVVCRVSGVTSSKGEEKSQEEKDLGTENSEERENNIACSRGNSETEICQESEITCGESRKETEEKESSSTNTGQKWKGCLSYAGAREFYLEGAQEYTACEEFFGWCNSK
ncbi:hypothetical protein VNO77_44765 [Canavalia gladiata]|uniref:non-specific serine/threonine protein kinase n=1 Tax=Canavalia gladiata TaxID=3824 RepID=A0AAN9JYN9_CANGL